MTKNQVLRMVARNDDHKRREGDRGKLPKKGQTIVLHITADQTDTLWEFIPLSDRAVLLNKWLSGDL